MSVVISLITERFVLRKRSRVREGRKVLKPKIKVLEMVLHLLDLLEQKADPDHVDEAKDEKHDLRYRRNQCEDLQRKAGDAVQMEGVAGVVLLPNVIAIRVVFPSHQLDAEVSGAQEDVDDPVEVEEEVNG